MYGGHMSSFNVPPRLNLPQPVRVTNAPASESAEHFSSILKERIQAVEADLEDGQVLTLEHHTPAGLVLDVQNVVYYRDTDLLMLQGFDAAGGLYQLIAPIRNLHLLLKVTSPPKPTPERKPIGFSSADAGQEGS